MSEGRDDFTERFGKRLREFRIARGLSQEGLAHAAGLHRTHISLIERNRRSVRLETLERLARALGIEPASLIPAIVGIEASDTESRAGVHHPDKSYLDRLFPSIREYQELATRHGIGDIFQDNGGKLLQALLILNLTFTGRREGNDAKDEHGHEYELKTVNIILKSSFTTHHHLNPKILEKYRNVKAWFFSIYHGIELIAIYKLTPDQLEDDYFSRWENVLQGSEVKHLNNPTIPMKYVVRKGECVYRDPVNNRL